MGSINRYYDPTTDQFVSIDPEAAVSNQPYAFAGDNPLNAEDADGLLPGPRYGDYPTGNLQNEITHYLGSDVGVKGGRSGDKIIFYDKDDPNKEVVYDTEKDYYRIERISDGKEEYYDRANDTWGENEALGNVGQQNSHYTNTGKTYDSVEDAQQAYGGDGSGGGGDGGDGGDGGAGDGGAADLGGFPLVFPNFCTWINGLCPPKKLPQT